MRDEPTGLVCHLYTPQALAQAGAHKTSSQSKPLKKLPQRQQHCLTVLSEPKPFHHSRVPVRVYTHNAPVGIYPETTFRIDSLLYCYVSTYSFILYQHITTKPFSVIILGVGSVTIFREPVIRYPVILRTYRLSPGLPPRPDDAAT